MMKTIVSASICLSNDFMRSLSALTRLASFVTELSPEAIKKLEDARDGWQNSRTPDFSNLLLVTKLVAIGVILEGPELVYEIINAVKRWREKPTREHAPYWITIVGLIGWLIVSIGVAGEFWVDGKVNTDDENIQSINITLLRDAGASAAQARIDANSAYDIAQGAAGLSASASGSAKAASLAASNAVSVASGARTEADSFEADIVSAKNGAADAVSRLAGAEQRLADATQRELAAEVEVNRLKTPRSLSNTANLIQALKPLTGTEYTLMTFADQESINLTREIGNALNGAGWIRKEPKTHSIGGVSYFNVFSDKGDDSVPSCIEIGVNVHVFSQVAIDVLQSTPTLNLPKEVQAADALHNALMPSISPSGEGNVGSVLEVDKDKNPTIGDGPVIVCVGKKP
jgi:hypothetical protein